MVVNRRPIVYYETLRRQSYAQQVKEIMAAKTAYILYADTDTADDAPVNVTAPVETVVLNPVEVTILKPQPIATVSNVTQPDAVRESHAMSEPNSQNQTAVPETSAVEVETPKVAEARTNAGNMTGLGLSLDSIFGEEKQAAAHAQSKYFKDSK